eukprot:362478-Chlamydomonas_euryale.AAC.4
MGEGGTMGRVLTQTLEACPTCPACPCPRGSVDLIAPCRCHWIPSVADCSSPHLLYPPPAYKLGPRRNTHAAKKAPRPPCSFPALVAPSLSWPQTAARSRPGPRTGLPSQRSAQTRRPASPPHQSGRCRRARCLTSR